MNISTQRRTYNKTLSTELSERALALLIKSEQFHSVKNEAEWKSNALDAAQLYEKSADLDTDTVKSIRNYQIAAIMYNYAGKQKRARNVYSKMVKSYGKILSTLKRKDNPQQSDMIKKYEAELAVVKAVLRSYNPILVLLRKTKPIINTIVEGIDFVFPLDDA